MYLSECSGQGFITLFVPWTPFRDWWNLQT